MSDIHRANGNFNYPGIRRWIVLAAGFFIVLLEMGTLKSYGLLINDITFQLDTSTAVIGMAIGLAHGISYCLTVVTVPLMNYLPGRWLVVSGCVIGSLGYILSAFSQSATHFVLAVLLSGIGNSLVQVPAYLIVIGHFTDQAMFKIATGIYLTGGGIGMMLIPLVTAGLMERYGWRGTILLLGAMGMNSIAFAAILKGVISPDNARNETRSLLIKTPVEENVSLMKNAVATFRNSVFIKHPFFAIVFLAIFLFGVTYNGWLVFVIPNAIAKGFSEEKAAYLATIGGAANIVGRFGVGFIAAKKECSNEVIFSSLNMISAAAFYLNQATSFFWGLGILAAINGLTAGAATVMIPLVTADNVSGQLFASALALTNSALGLGEPVGGAIVGKCFDETKSLDLSFIVAGAIATTTSFLILLPAIYRYCVDLRKLEKQ